MKDAEFFKVKYTLTEQIARPGGMTVAISTQRAARELAAKEGEAKKNVGQTIGRLETLCRSQSATMDEVYDQGVLILDIAGLFDERTLCEAAYSLCELTDRLRTQGRVDWTAVGVHVEALRLIWSVDKEAAETLTSVLDGLRAVTDKYRETPAA